MPLAPFHPIIYVRGYAMSAAERDEAAADPFCGFNLGSTLQRATTDRRKPARKFVFESPVVRLMSDHGYSDVYEQGLDIMDPDWSSTIPYRSIIVFRYYDDASHLLGMGGLICRAFLQNTALASDEARACVDKLFTYATPHNGIEMAGIKVPSWLGTADLDNFSQARMAEYLELKGALARTHRVDWTPESRFPSRRVFCLVGTNRADYEVAAGLSRTFAGHGSDGLVRVANASVWGLDDAGNVSQPCATAYVYRAHSGPFGIVNSEEGYQNLTRFLFGDVRADLSVAVSAVRLPAPIAGKDVRALYQFEAKASPRGKRWFLTRRTAEEDSVACRTLDDLRSADAARQQSYLSTVFLSRAARVDPSRPSLAFVCELGVRTPDYEVDLRFWPDQHYEGGYLFRDALLLEIVPPQSAADQWQVTGTWESQQGDASSALPTAVLVFDASAAEPLVEIPFTAPGAPGLDGVLRVRLSR
ncbi:MAG: hypothetical protein NTW72_09835, partial [Gemmatimonadetes bacterium]|nr:hypothetical protein [Gemmatimonadota bacterium]